MLLKHEQTLKAIEKAIGYMSELHEAFSEHHPEFCKGYENIIMMLTQTHDFVTDMRKFV